MGSASTCNFVLPLCSGSDISGSITTSLLVIWSMWWCQISPLSSINLTTASPSLAITIPGTQLAPDIKFHAVSLSPTLTDMGCHFLLFRFCTFVIPLGVHLVLSTRCSLRYDWIFQQKCGTCTSSGPCISLNPSFSVCTVRLAKPLDDGWYGAVVTLSLYILCINSRLTACEHCAIDRLLRKQVVAFRMWHWWMLMELCTHLSTLNVHPLESTSLQEKVHHDPYGS